MIEIRPLTGANFADAEEVVRSRFDDSAIDVLRKVANNPLRELCDEMGDVAYDDGRPVCFQACILRKFYLGAEAIVGRVGGLTCLKPGSSPEAVIDIRQAARRERGGSRMGLGNSQNPETAYMAHRSRRAIEGPKSCTCYSWRAVRPFACALYFVRRKLLRHGIPDWRDFSTLDSVAYSSRIRGVDICRVSKVSADFYDILMERYLKTNKGLVSSRTAREIEWIFGERIRKGEVVVLGAFDDQGPIGYILADGERTARRWYLLDWFAVENDDKVLDGLLVSLCKFLRKHTPAMMLETRGFPMFAQKILKRHMPHVRPIGHNVFSFGTKDTVLREKFRKMVEGNQPCWFFGPYDGDECF